MKRLTYLSLALLALTAATAKADDRFGIFGGLNLADMHVSPSTSKNDPFGTQAYLMGGVYADFGLTEELFLEPQIRYVQKGADFSVLDSSFFDVNFALRYIEVPLYLKYKFSGGTTFRPNIFAGPAYGRKIGDEISVRNKVTGQSVDRRNTAGNDIRKDDFSVDAGVGMEFTLSESTIARLSATYSHGLTNIASTGTNRVYNRGIHFTAGIGF